MNTSENPLKKTLVSNPSSSFSYISISSFPDFLHPEKEIQNKEIYELFLYLTQTINWPYYSFLDIFKRQNNIPKDMNFKIWENNIINKENEIKSRIITNIKNKNSKLIIESLHDYMKFLNMFFSKPCGDKIRTFIFLEFFLKKLENDIYIKNSDEYCHLFKLYFSLCRDTENVFNYLSKKNILIKNELFNKEKGYYYERIHKYIEANNIYIEGFINILDNDNKGNLLMENYKNFEKRMLDRIERDLEGLNEDWKNIDGYIKKLINEYKEKNKFNNLSKKKYFLNRDNNDINSVDYLIKNININFNIINGTLNILNSNNISNNGIEIIDSFGNIKYIANPPDVINATSITYIYELIKRVLSTFFPEWKKEYDNFDLEVKTESEKLPFSWMNNQRPTKLNIKNIKENNNVINLVKKEYFNENKNKVNEIEVNNKEEKIENKENDHDISNMLSNIGLILDKKDNNNNKQNINESIINNINNITKINSSNNNINNVEKKNSNIPLIKQEVNYTIIEKDNKTLIENMKYQIEHPYQKKSKTGKNINDNNENINQKNKKKLNTKINKFKNIGKLNFDQDGLMIINLENDFDKKVNIMQSATKLMNNKIEDKKSNKKYLFTLNNIPRRITYIKNKTLEEKELYDKRRKEMLQGVNFDYLNSFKKLFETYPELNNLLDNDKLKGTKIQELNINLEKIPEKNNRNIMLETNIERQDGTSDAMKLLLEVYGIPQNFLEENNPFIEYAKKNGINNDFAFENLFKDIKSYIEGKSKSKRRNNIYTSKPNKNIENKNNIDADGDLIIESESDNDSEEKLDKIEVKKGSKHCIFDSKKNSQIVYIKNENNQQNNEIGKIIDNINKKAEKGIKIGEKMIFSNYKNIKEHSFNINNNKNNNDLQINNNIEISINEKEKEDEINKQKMMLNNSKISANIFMSAFNYDLNENKINIDKKRSKSKKRKFVSNSLTTEKIEKNLENNAKINEKENKLSNIKEIVSNEKEKNIDGKSNSIINKNKNKKNEEFGIIGNIHDLDNFDDLFK